MAKVDFDEGLRYGLRRESRGPINSQALTQAMNCRVTPEGIVAFDPPYDPFTTQQTLAWPFPQLFRGRNVTLLCYEQAIYLVDETTSPWGLSQYTTYDAASLGSTKAIAASGGAWHFIDFGPAWILLNETNVVFKAGMDVGTRLDKDKVAVSTAKPLVCGCDWRKRAFLGGFSWGSTWEDVLTGWLAEAPASLERTFSVNENTVVWTEIGAGSIWGLLLGPDWAHYGVLAEDTTVTADLNDSLFMMELKKNELGIMPMSWQGAVLHLRALGDGVCVYGEGGVTLLKYVQTPGVATFGKTEVLDGPGVLSREAVGGDDRGHLFVSTSKELWFVKPDASAERLGYREYLTELTAPIAIVHDREKDVFHISDSDQGFILSSGGLTRCKTIVSSGFRASNAFIGTYDLNMDETADASMLLSTDKQDNGTRRDKNIIGVQVHCKVRAGTVWGGFDLGFDAGFETMTGNRVYARLRYRQKMTDSWKTGNWFRMGDDGWIEFGVQALEYYVDIKVIDYEETEIYGLEVFFEAMHV